MGTPVYQALGRVCRPGERSRYCAVRAGDGVVTGLGRDAQSGAKGQLGQVAEAKVRATGILCGAPPEADGASPHATGTPPHPRSMCSG